MKKQILYILLFSITFHIIGCEKVENKNEQPVKELNKESQSQSPKTTAPIQLQELNSFADLVKSLKPAVVNISTTSKINKRSFPFSSPFNGESPFDEYFRRFFGDMPQQEFKRRGMGTGFIISKDGYVVTNNHVVSNADNIEIVLEDGNKYSSTIVGTDPNTDLALLKIKETGVFPYVSFGNSDESSIGDWVLAIGNPFGLGHTVTAGIISAKGRVLGLGNYDDFIQTDAPINPGNSGGPLFNLNGEVVGVNTAIISRGQGIGFAIPGNLARNIIEQIKDNGKVIRGWVGLYIQKISPEISEAMGIKENSGVLVADISPGSPAESAGLKRGDIITMYEGEPINQITDLTGKVALTSPGTKVKLDIIRNKQKKQITIKVDEMPETEEKPQSKTEKPEAEPGLIGLNVINITPDLVRRYNLPSDTGVLVTSVAGGSIASESGFKRGDIILSINKQKINSVEDYTKIIDTLDVNQSALFLIQRGNNTVYIGLRIPDNN